MPNVTWPREQIWYPSQGSDPKSTEFSIRKKSDITDNSVPVLPQEQSLSLVLFVFPVPLMHT
jgi:hypothetical protein